MLKLKTVPSRHLIKPTLSSFAFGAKAGIKSLFSLAAIDKPKKVDAMTHQDGISIRTIGHRHMQDLTQEVADIVSRSGIATGTAHIFNVGSTGVVGTIEFEPGLERDLPEILDKLLPPNREYGHEQAWHDGNGHSHLQASWLGPDLTIPVRDSRPVLGTWQQIFHLECDVKPREREIVVTVAGD